MQRGSGVTFSPPLPFVRVEQGGEADCYAETIPWMTKHFSPEPSRSCFQDFNAVLIMKLEGGVSVSRRETNPLNAPRHARG